MFSLKKYPISTTMIAGLLFTIAMLVWGGNSYGSGFIQDFASNWLSTFLGVIIGLPLALILADFQEKTTEKVRKKKLLAVIRVELYENLVSINNWIDLGRNKTEVCILGALLKDESWSAVSDGGELEWIKDPFLLAELSDAYSTIRSIKYLADKSLQLNEFGLAKSKYTADAVWKLLDSAIKYALHEIQAALDVIDKEEPLSESKKAKLAKQIEQ